LHFVDKATTSNNNSSAGCGPPRNSAQLLLQRIPQAERKVMVTCFDLELQLPDAVSSAAGEG
jgi:hypothetical protein